MPIYEFYCAPCNTIYNFFSRSVNTDKVPACPKCKALKLSRQVSVFSNPSRSKEEGDDDMPPFNERAMEKAMGHLAREAERLDENDPRQAASLMRKLSDATGLKTEEAVRELYKETTGDLPSEARRRRGKSFDWNAYAMTDGYSKEQIDHLRYDSSFIIINFKSFTQFGIERIN